MKDIASRLNIPYKTVQPWFANGKSHSDPSPENLTKIKRLLHPETQPAEIQPELGVVSKANAEAAATASKKASEGSTTMSPNVVSKEHGKTIRDSVQMDVELTPLEVRIIDTPSFQRLRHIKQLGTASLVFPGATHTRFDHSLGTLAAAQIMIDAVKRNLDNPSEISREVEELIRLCALLHDITDIPFGHTLEDEGFLYKRHDDTAKKPDSPPWKNTRWELFLGPSSEIGAVLEEDLSQEVLLYLTTKGDKINELEHPYVVDMVGNTVCADLIDYLARDTYYAGLKETFDPRFLRNLTIASYAPAVDGEKGYRERLVLSVLKQNRVRRDVISEVMHLLRLRYSLAEKVYFHHAKVIASAMIIEAVQAALISKPSEFTENALCGMRFGDDELLIKLRESKVPIAEKLVEKLSSRKLYKPVYMLPYSTPSAEDTSQEKKLNIIKKFRDNHRERFEIERRLEKWNLLPEGSVIIYCPTEEMNLKEIETLCLWRNDQVMPLTDIPGEKFAFDAQSISIAHQELWKLYVFVERGLKGEREIMHHLASDCSREFKLPNYMEEYAEMGMPPLDRYIEQWALNRPDLALTIPEKQQLVGSRGLWKEGSTADPPSYDDLGKYLKDIRKQ